MTRNGVASNWWIQVREEGFFSVFAKVLFLILIYGLALVLILTKEHGGINWLFSRLPILEAVYSLSFVGLYIFWLVSLWIGFQFGKRAGMARGAVKERNRMLGIRS